MPAQESDSTCKRNAFVTLCSISQPTAVRYLLNNFDQISGMDELMQMAVIELVRKEAKTEGGHRVSLRPARIRDPPRRARDNSANGDLKARWIRCIFELLNAPSHAVKYEAATSLTTLTQNPAAVKGEWTFRWMCRVTIADTRSAAAAAFAELIIKEADNNVKLIVLDRFDSLRAKHEHVLDAMVMDILKVLSR
jgi:coatomer subunit beta